VNFLRSVDFVNSFVEDRLATLRNVIKDPALDQWNLYLGTPLPTCHVWVNTLNLYFKGTFCQSWLFCIQHLPFLINFPSMPGSSVEFWSQNILYMCTEGQTYFDMPRRVKMSLTLNEPKKVALHSNSNTISKHVPQVKRDEWCMQNNK
jgi:hypothetical protein